MREGVEKKNQGKEVGGESGKEKRGQMRKTG